AGPQPHRPAGGHGPSGAAAGTTPPFARHPYVPPCPTGAGTGSRLQDPERASPARSADLTGFIGWTAKTPEGSAMALTQPARGRPVTAPVPDRQPWDAVLQARWAAHMAQRPGMPARSPYVLYRGPFYS